MLEYAGFKTDKMAPSQRIQCIITVLNKSTRREVVRKGVLLRWSME